MNHSCCRSARERAVGRRAGWSAASQEMEATEAAAGTLEGWAARAEDRGEEGKAGADVARAEAREVGAVGVKTVAEAREAVGWAATVVMAAAAKTAGVKE